MRGAQRHPAGHGREGASGSTIGPDGALYVTEGAAGRISRVDPNTGEITTFASGLPKRSSRCIGGAIDVAFIDNTAYALVTLVGPDFGGSDVDGIYRVDGPDSFTVVADIGEFALVHPPTTPFLVPTGLQYAMQTYRGGFLVTDGHLNRVFRVTLDGEITVFDRVRQHRPDRAGGVRQHGLHGRGRPRPPPPENGKVVSFGPESPTATEVASGVPLLVDVEFGRGHRFTPSRRAIFPGGPPGSPALPNTGALVKVNGDGTFTVIMDGLDRPTSLEFIGNTAYVVTLTGEIWKIDGVSCPH